MIAIEAKSKADEMQKKIILLEAIAFNRGIGERGNLKRNETVKGNCNSKSMIKNNDAIRKKEGPIMLIIDNDATNRRRIKEYFEPKKFKIIEAANSGRGIKFQLKKNADIIIIEARLPGIDGIETTVSIRQKFLFTPIILMSRGGFYGTEIDFDIAEKLGALTIAKPFKLNRLAEMVKSSLHHGLSHGT